MMKTTLLETRSLVLPALLATSLSAVVGAQGFLHMPASLSPDINDLGTYAEVPWTRTAARVQQFYSAGEVGAQSFVATGMDLRFDGPIPPVGSPGPFRIDRVTIKFGTSTVPIPGPVFDLNMTSQPTVVFDQPVTYWPDQGFQSPEPWGGLNGSLTFPFNSPVSVTIPSGGWLVIEIALAGNNLQGSAHAMLDAEAGQGGPFDGNAFNTGTGCAAPGSMPATITTTGVHAPGAVHYIGGSNLGANSPVVAILGVSQTQAAFGALPWNLPGTSCFAYNSWDLFVNGVADANGSIRVQDPALAVPLLADNSLLGATYHVQLASVVPGANQPWNLVFSDSRTVQLGGINPLSKGMYAVSNRDSATAPFADFEQEFGYAVRLHTK